jgi:hypothetical protein
MRTHQYSRGAYRRGRKAFQFEFIRASAFPTPEQRKTPQVDLTDDTTSLLFFAFICAQLMNVCCRGIAANIQRYRTRSPEWSAGAGHLLETYSMAYMDEPFFAAGHARDNFGQFAFRPLASKERL